MRVEISFKNIFKATATDNGWECESPVFKRQLEAMTKNAENEYIGYQPVRSTALKLALVAMKNLPGIIIEEIKYDTPIITAPDGRVY